MAASLLSGVVFGAALTASGVHHPSVIIDQLRFEDWRMFKAFFTAVATSTVLISVFRGTGYADVPPKRHSSLGLFAHFDGNLIGGGLLGVGMALSGSCPGTVLAQVGVGISSGFLALGGAVAAGIAWSGLFRPWLRSRVTTLGSDSNNREQLKTVDECLGATRTQTTVLFVATLTVAVAGLELWTMTGPATALAAPVAGGMLIGLAQLVSLLLRRAALGVSTAYEEAGDVFWWRIKSPKLKQPKTTSITFAAGVVTGAWALGTAFPSSDSVPLATIPASWSILGGFLLALGARMAGGCTSGHGITGMSMLSLSSIVTICTALLIGMVTANLLSSIGQ